jgi:hypothetical protein
MKNFLKWVQFVAFGILLLGGMNWLIIGLFEFDMIAELFGGMGSTTARVIYAFYGISALVLTAIVVWRVFFEKKTATRAAKTTRPKTITA